MERGRWERAGEEEHGERERERERENSSNGCHDERLKGPVFYTHVKNGSIRWIREVFGDMGGDEEFGGIGRLVSCGGLVRHIREDALYGFQYRSKDHGDGGKTGWFMRRRMSGVGWRSIGVLGTCGTRWW